MPTNPTTPNLTDYVSFLSGVAGIPPANIPEVFPTLTSTATSGDINTLIDNSQDWDSNQWAGYSAVDVTQNEVASIVSNDNESLSFLSPVGNPVLAGDQYLIVPDVVVTSFQIAMEIVNDTLACVSSRIYTLAVYNLATDRLINFAPDVVGQTFFQDLRGPTKFDVNRVRIGVPSSANDAGTGVGILNPEQLKMLTLGDLQTLATPFGRQYMAFAQAFGTTIWGLS